ncbi:MAG TPA: hypothetical protein VN841_12270 [Bryobacteraceae bacterium]|nr:hypothetical protein [Bryobacteraceae bacterium]
MSDPAPRSARLTVQLVVVLASAALLFPPAATAEPQSLTATDNSLPSGLVVVIQNKPGQALDLRALNNSYISGVALQIHWRDIEPVQGNPDWSKLDQLFAAAQASKKWVQLLIFPGFFSPAWALQGAKTESFGLQYGPGKGGVERLPMPWDKVYLGHWFAFLKQVSDRYGKSPAFRVIAADGPTSVSAEFTLPSTPEDVRIWRSVSYTPRKYLDAWQNVFQVFAADFPNQYISLSLGFGLNINDRGQLDARERVRTKQAVIDQGISLLGRRFALQYSNLDGNAGADQGPPGTALVMGYNGRIVTGFQLRTSCERNSGNMGAEGDPPLALKRSIDKGTARNNSGHRINYLEIYEPDILAEEMQPVLRNGAALFAK